MKVLFICRGNCFRSQMAAAIYNKLTNSTLADSAGTAAEPEGRKISSTFKKTDFFELMEENNMNIRDNLTKKLLPEMLTGSDVVISMAQEPYIPEFLRNDKKVVWWDIEDPKSVDRKIAEDTYNKIYILVNELVDTLIKK